MRLFTARARSGHFHAAKSLQPDDSSVSETSRAKCEMHICDTGDSTAGLAMAYRLLAAAQERWRCVIAPHLVALVRAGATPSWTNPSSARTNGTPRDHPRQPTTLDNFSPMPLGRA
jgi:hypothetical protein